MSFTLMDGGHPFTLVGFTARVSTQGGVHTSTFVLRIRVNGEVVQQQLYTSHTDDLLGWLTYICRHHAPACAPVDYSIRALPERRGFSEAIVTLRRGDTEYSASVIHPLGVHALVQACLDALNTLIVSGGSVVT